MLRISLSLFGREEYISHLLFGIFPHSGFVDGRDIGQDAVEPLLFVAFERLKRFGTPAPPRLAWRLGHLLRWREELAKVRARRFELRPLLALTTPCGTPAAHPHGRAGVTA
jgi:hypothetical protein